MLFLSPELAVGINAKIVAAEAVIGAEETAENEKAREEETE